MILGVSMPQPKKAYIFDRELTAKQRAAKIVNRPATRSKTFRERIRSAAAARARQIAVGFAERELAKRERRG